MPHNALMRENEKGGLGRTRLFELRIHDLRLNRIRTPGRHFQAFLDAPTITTCHQSMVRMERSCIFCQNWHTTIEPKFDTSHAPFPTLLCKRKKRFFSVFISSPTSMSMLDRFLSIRRVTIIFHTKQLPPSLLRPLPPHPQQD